MAVRGWRPAVAALAAGRPGGGGPGGASAPGAGPGPEPGAPGGAATAALYVHWPYCRKHCSYCSFNKYVVPAVDEAAVRACLVREARTLLRLGQVQSVTSVFFGGGTPSLASPQTIAAVLEAAAEAAHLPAGAEVTLEANPSSASPARLAGFRAAGVNRLSVGVQSLDDAELRLLGREHTADEARAAVEAARGLFPGRTSIDLLFGLPGQSREAWAQCLEAALGLCDDHLALYQLTLERGTALEARVRRGALPAPPQDLLADMYHTARAVLAAAGFRQYEVSNFARKGALSTHNLSYWRAEQYIGVGPGAHGRFVPWGEGSCQREARVQTPDPDTWMKEVQSHGHGTRRRAALSPLEQLEELLALGLRTDEGVTQQLQRCWARTAGTGGRGTGAAGGRGTEAAGGQGTEAAGGQGTEARGGRGPETAGGQGTEAAGGQGTEAAGGQGTEARGGRGPETAGGQGTEAHGGQSPEARGQSLEPTEGQSPEAVGARGTEVHGGRGPEAGGQSPETGGGQDPEAPGGRGPRRPRPGARQGAPPGRAAPRTRRAARRAGPRCSRGRRRRCRGGAERSGPAGCGRRAAGCGGAARARGRAAGSRAPGPPRTRRKRHVNNPSQGFQRSQSLFHTFCEGMTSKHLQLS
ncbi:radical S-adenosyl methionine domain-containing protein 1, mitochondrial isoform X11 [Anser cygnoides]|uniref:radical S-adenosyl methionine domain-containing protein 1, mitochondrial isoform X11 n=1 Tax=Anser cygnoides TaxID=8845 RepID=UPI0034D1CF93